MIGIVLVSHSPLIAQGIADLIREMAPDCPLALAAGVDDPERPIGTDAVKIMQAVEEVMGAEGVAVMVDLGSAILSAQTALDLLDPEIAQKTAISAAPIVEGALAAAIAASGGADLKGVLREASGALSGKQNALGEEEPPAAADSPLSGKGQQAAPPAAAENARQAKVRLAAAHGLHARPAARLIAALRDFDAKLILEKEGRFADARSMNDISALQARQNDEIILHAEGGDAAAAIEAFLALAAVNFGDDVPAESKAPAADDAAREICGRIVRLPAIGAPAIPALNGDAAQEKLAQAGAAAKQRLQGYAQQAQKQLGEDLAEIFSAHEFLLEDLLSQAQALLAEGRTLDAAWQESCAAAEADFQSLDDPYLRARDADIIDIAMEMAFLLADTARPTYAAPPAAEAESIWLLDDLLVSQVLSLPAQVAAVCVRNGNAQSHAAFCCRGRNIAYLAEWPAELAAAAQGSYHCIRG